MDIYRLTVSMTKEESLILQKAVFDLVQDDVRASQVVIMRALLHLMPDRKKLLATVKELQKDDGRRTRKSD